MDFGITLKPDMSPERVVALTRQAEQAGFGYGWLFDSHVLWLEPYPLLTLMALNTERMRLGTCVTNPASRDPSVTASALATLNLISGGRMDLGIGRGDSARRVLGKKPTTLARLEEAVKIIKDLAEGRPTDYDGERIQAPWAKGELPVWIAGYGPKALHLTGRIADGVILQFADPHLIKWCLQFVRQGAEAAGRDPRSIKVMAAAPVWVSDDLKTAREHVRWFPALVSNHVMDLIARYDVTDRFCIVGTVQDHRRKLQELADIGVSQFNVYLMSGDEEQTLGVYGREIVPAFKQESGVRIQESA